MVERASRAGEEIDGPLAAAALSVAATAGGEEEWEAFAAMYRDGDTPQQQRRYLQALASFPQPELLQRTLAKTLDGYVRSQDLPFLIGGCLTSREHGNAAWAFVKENWDALRSSLTPHLLVFMVEGVRVFSTQEQRDDVLAFFEAHPLERGQKMLVHALERQSVAVALREREAGKLSAASAAGGRLGA
jgi:aminopeptidase N